MCYNVTDYDFYELEETTMKEKSTTANTHSNFEVTELGADDFAPDYEDEARQSICRGCPFMGDGCNACLHD